MDEAMLTYDDLKEAGAEWAKRIDQSEKREKQWRLDAAHAEKVFACDDERTGVEGDVPNFNILHSNTATVVPALYNDTPSPDIRPRHDDQPGEDGQFSPIKEASEALEAVISTTIDDSALDMEMEALAQDAFISGRAVLRVRFDAAETAEGISDERVIYEAINWDDYREGPATRWEDVPWVAFRHSISAEAVELIEERTPEIAQALATGRSMGESKGSNDKGDAFVWEIWDKDSKCVYFLADGSGEIIDKMEDPLQLRGFFPIPRPVQPITITGRRRPTCPYHVYQGLAEDLEAINTRIAKLVRQLRPRGGVVGDASDIAKIGSANDGELIPIMNAEQLVAMGGLDKAITWWPMEPTILAIRELVQQREIIKQQIYEITGISDILRGQGAASETATAQNIKNQWGTLRVEAMQTMISRCVRDVFVMTAEIVARLFSDEAIVRAAGVQISPEAMAAIRQPLMHYRIDVESDSTRKADMTTTQMQAQAFLQGTASYFQTMAPVTQANPALIAPAVELYASFARRFNLGRQAEAALEQLIALGKQPQQPQGPSPDQLKAEADAKAEEARMQFDYEKLGAEMGIKQAELELKRAELELKKAQLGLEGARALGEMEREDIERIDSERMGADA